jgi:hypothetical protein
VKLLSHFLRPLAQLVRQARIEFARLRVGRKVGNQGGFGRLGFDLIDLSLKVGHEAPRCTRGGSGLPVAGTGLGTNGNGPS